MLTIFELALYSLFALVSVVILHLIVILHDVTEPAD